MLLIILFVLILYGLFLQIQQIFLSCGPEIIINLKRVQARSLIGSKSGPIAPRTIAPPSDCQFEKCPKCKPCSIDQLVNLEFVRSFHKIFQFFQLVLSQNQMMSFLISKFLLGILSRTVISSTSGPDRLSDIILWNFPRHKMHHFLLSFLIADSLASQYLHCLDYYKLGDLSFRLQVMLASMLDLQLLVEHRVWKHYSLLMPVSKPLKIILLMWKVI